MSTTTRTSADKPSADKPSAPSPSLEDNSLFLSPNDIRRPLPPHSLHSTHPHHHSRSSSSSSLSLPGVAVTPVVAANVTVTANSGEVIDEIDENPSTTLDYHFTSTEIDSSPGTSDSPMTAPGPPPGSGSPQHHRHGLGQTPSKSTDNPYSVMTATTSSTASSPTPSPKTQLRPPSRSKTLAVKSVRPRTGATSSAAGSKIGSGMRHSLLDLPPSTITTRSTVGGKLGRLRVSRSQTDLRTPFSLNNSGTPRSPTSPKPKHSHRSANRKKRVSAEPRKPVDESKIERDQYGFRKGNRYLSLEEIKRFEAEYEPTVERRMEKWDGMLRDNNGQLLAICSKVKRFIRKGIPAGLRGRCWLFYSGAEEYMKRNRGRYHQLVALSSDRKYREYRDLIERDLHRTFPENIRFTSTASRSNSSSSTISTSGKERRAPLTSRFRQPQATSTVPALQQLRRVLTAFAVRCPSVGYCQSLNYVAGIFLLFMSEEEAFWMLCTVVERIMPEGMYGVKMEGVTVDQEVLMRLLEERLPAIYRRLHQEESASGAPPVTFVTSHWFLTLFVDVLPIETTLRVWDCLFLEGSEVLFRVALTLFKMHEQNICSIEDPLELFQYLQNMPKRLINCHWLMENCFRKYTSLTHVNTKELDRRRQQARELTRRRVAGTEASAEQTSKHNSPLGTQPNSGSSVRL